MPNSEHTMLSKKRQFIRARILGHLMAKNDKVLEIVIQKIEHSLRYNSMSVVESKTRDIPIYPTP